MDLIRALLLLFGLTGLPGEEMERLLRKFHLEDVLPEIAAARARSPEDLPMRA